MPVPSAADQPLELLEGKRFSFYPAIRELEHNEWEIKEETWSEILVWNVHDDREIWLPRSYLGDISTSDSPLLIVGLKSELQLKAGSVVPFRNQVVSMPGPRVAAPERASELEPERPEREDSGTETQTINLIGRAVAISLIIAFFTVVVIFKGLPGPLAGLFRADTSTADQRYLALTSSDSYFVVVENLGEPGREQWLSGAEAELQLQVLWYSERRYAVVLMGGSRADTRYIGTVHDPTRKILDSARLGGGGDTSSMMRNLPEF